MFVRMWVPKADINFEGQSLSLGGSWGDIRNLKGNLSKYLCMQDWKRSFMKSKELFKSW